ncbi:hypothetical protein QAD02_016072 [Eretmocerus hayati]|uniref:Uncharacterized protein n=1 Tax=Eretmocerus hayati TaxID=131215 RepID=A0ACC2PA70_9HYME|nr:hypothetical protein QAD02_016072 [Eretmocerus hayati]
MPRNSRWKLAIVTSGITECLVYAEAKYCAFEIHGEPKYYVCPKTEYCCNFGCCVSPGFQIYHLWYYWLLVIIMFLVCSGGGWWYRYWLQGRYRAATSAIPTRSSNLRSQSSLRSSACQAQQARISYNTARNTVLLHRMWKGPQRGSVAYGAGLAGASAAAAAASSGVAHHYQNTSVLLNDVGCPYYQLYGPPPSYETVIAQSRAAAAAKQLQQQQQQQQQQQTDGTPDASTTTTTSTNPIVTEESCCIPGFSTQDGRCPEMSIPQLPGYFYGTEGAPGFVAPLTAPSWQGWYTRFGTRDDGMGCSSQLEPCGVAIQQQAHLAHQQQQMALAVEAERNMSGVPGGSYLASRTTLPHHSGTEGTPGRAPGPSSNVIAVQPIAAATAESISTSTRPRKGQSKRKLDRSRSLE